MLKEWELSKEEKVPFSLNYCASNVNSFLKINATYETDSENDFVPHTTYWLINETKKVIGTSNVRHKLNADLLIENGHIRYGIRPGFRGTGMATQILDLSLKKAKVLGIKRALLTCEKTNIASKKVILKNGGVLRKESLVNKNKSQAFG